MKVNAIDIITMAIDSFTEQTGLSVNQSSPQELERCSVRFDSLVDLTSASSFSAEVNKLTRELEVSLTSQTGGLDLPQNKRALVLENLLYLLDSPAMCAYKTSTCESDGESLVQTFIFDRVFDQSHVAQ